MLSSQDSKSVYFSEEEIKSLSSSSSSSQPISGNVSFAHYYYLSNKEKSQKLFDDEECVTNKKLLELNIKSIRIGGDKGFYQFITGRGNSDQKDVPPKAIQARTEVQPKKNKRKTKITQTADELLKNVHEIYDEIPKHEPIIAREEIKKVIGTLEEHWGNIQNFRKSKMANKEQLLGCEQEFVIFLLSQMKIVRNNDNYKLLIEIFKSPHLLKLYKHTLDWTSLYLSDNPNPDLNHYWKAYSDSLLQTGLWTLPREEINSSEHHLLKIMHSKISQSWEGVKLVREKIRKDYLEKCKKHEEFFSLKKEYRDDITDKLFKELILLELGHISDADPSIHSNFLLGDSAKIWARVDNFIQNYLRKEKIDLKVFHQDFRRFLQNYHDYSKISVEEESLLEKKLSSPKEEKLCSTKEKKLYSPTEIKPSEKVKVPEKVKSFTPKPPLELKQFPPKRVERKKETKTHPHSEPIAAISPPIPALSWTQRIWNFLRRIFTVRRIPAAQRVPINEPVPSVSIVSSLVNVFRRLGCCERNPILEMHEPFTSASFRGGREFFRQERERDLKEIPSPSNEARSSLTM
jgi:hypothetical protein